MKLRDISRPASEATAVDVIVVILCFAVGALLFAIAIAPEPMATLILGGMR